MSNKRKDFTPKKEDDETRRVRPQIVHLVLSDDDSEPDIQQPQDHGKLALVVMNLVVK